MKNACTKLFMALGIVLALSAIHAATPIAFWDGNLSDSSTTNGFTMTFGPNATESAGTAVLDEKTSYNAGSDVHTGVSIDWEEAAFSGQTMTVLVKYSGFSQSSLSGNTALLGAYWGSSDKSSETLINAKPNKFRAAYGVTSSSAGSNSDSMYCTLPTEGIMGVSFSSSGTQIRFWAKSGDSWEKTVDEEITGISALAKTAGFYGIKIGGSISQIGAYFRPGMTISGVAIYDVVVPDEDVASALTDELGLHPAYWYKFDGNLYAVGEDSLAFKGENAASYVDSIDDGQAYVFASGSAPYGTGIKRGEEFTIVTVAKTADLDHGIIWSQGESGTARGFALVAVGSNQVALRVFGANWASSGDDLIVANVPNATTSYHVYTLTYTEDKSAKEYTFKLYVDGNTEPVGSGNTADGASQTGFPNTSFQFGSLYSGLNHGMVHGYGICLDEYRLYRQVLSPEQIATVAKSFGTILVWGNVGSETSGGVTTQKDGGAYTSFTVDFGEVDNISQSEIEEYGRVKIKKIRLFRRIKYTTSAPATITISQGTETNVVSTSVTEVADQRVYGPTWPEVTTDFYTTTAFEATFDSDIEFDTTQPITLTFPSSQLMMVKPANSVMQLAGWSPAIEIKGVYRQTVATRTFSATLEGEQNWSELEWSPALPLALYGSDTLVVNAVGDNAKLVMDEQVSTAASISFTGTTVTLAADSSFYTDGCWSKDIIKAKGIATESTLAFAPLQDGFYGAYTAGDTAISLRAQNKEVISINIAGGKEGGSGSDSPAANLVSGSDYYGLFPVPGDSWNNINRQWQDGGNQTITNANPYAYDGQVITNRPSMKLTATGKNTWQANIGHPFLRGYLDDGNGVTVEVHGIPYTKYDVIVYATSDTSSIKLAPITINGTQYTYADGATTPGSAVWGQGLATTPELGKNALMVTNCTGEKLTINSTRVYGSPSGRATLCAVQVVNMGDEVLEAKKFTAVTSDGGYFFGLDWGIGEDESINGPLNEATVIIEGAASEGEVLLDLDYWAMGSDMQLAKLSLVGERDVRIHCSCEVKCIGEYDVSGLSGRLTLDYPVTSLTSSEADIAYSGGSGGDGSTEVQLVGGRLALIGGQWSLNCPATAVKTAVDIYTAYQTYLYFSDPLEIGNADYSIFGNFYALDLEGAGIDIDEVVMNAVANCRSTLTISNSVWMSVDSMVVGRTTGDSVLTLNGGRLEVGGIEVSANANGTHVLNLNGGELVLGEGGISSAGTATLQINAAGGEGCLTARTSSSVSDDTISITQPLSISEGTTLQVGAYCGSAVRGELFLGGPISNAGTLDVTFGVVVVPYGTDLGNVVTNENSKIAYALRTSINDCGRVAIPAGLTRDDIHCLYDDDNALVPIVKSDDSYIYYDWDVTGENCLWDYEFENDVADSGASGVALTFDGTHGHSGAEYDDGALYVSSRPWRKVDSWPEATTFMMYGKMVAGGNCYQVCFGSTSQATRNAIFLASGESDNEVKLCKVYGNVNNSGTAPVVLCTMNVPNAQTANHLYGFVLKTVDGHSEVDVYLDGQVLQPYVFDEVVTLGGGFQIGSLHGGVTTGFTWADDDDPATIDWLRVYDEELNSAAMAEYAKLYPYVPSGGMYSRLADGEWVQSEAWSTSGVECVSVPAASAGVQIDTDVASAIAVNLDEDVAYDSMTIAGTKALTLSRGDGEGRVVIDGRTTIGCNCTFDYTAIRLGGPVTIADDCILTINLANVDLKGFADGDDVALTGYITATDVDRQVVFTLPAAQGERSLETYYDVHSGRFHLLAHAPLITSLLNDYAVREGSAIKVSCNDAATSSQAANAFDDNELTYFEPGSTANANGVSWTGIEFTNSVIVTRITFIGRSGEYHRMVGGAFQGANSADFSDAVNIHTVEKYTGGEADVTLEDAKGPFKYLRFIGTQGGNVAEIKFYGLIENAAGSPTAKPTVLDAWSHNGVAGVCIAANDAVPQVYRVQRAMANFCEEDDYETCVTLAGVRGEDLTWEDTKATGYSMYRVQGVNANGESGWTYFTITPEPLINGAAAPSFGGDKPGFYDEAATVTITYPDEAATIYYTTDGSTPTTNSYKYTEPIALADVCGNANPLSQIRANPTEMIAKQGKAYAWYAPSGDQPNVNIIRARAFLPDGSASTNDIAGTWMIGEIPNDHSLRVVSIQTDYENYFGDEKGILVPGDIYTQNGFGSQSVGRPNANYFQKGMDWERPAQIEMFEANRGKEMLSLMMGTRVHGNYSRSAAKKTLVCYARKEYGQKNIKKVQLFGDEPDHTKFKRFTLRNGGNDWYKICLRDAVGQSLFRGEGVTVNTGTQGYEPVVVYINGEYWGLYNLRHAYSKQHFEEWNGAVEDDIDYVKVGDSGEGCRFELQEGDFCALWDIMRYMISCTTDGAMDDDEFAEVASKVDIDDMIDYHIVHIFLGNNDWLGNYNNMGLWRNRSGADQKWHFTVYDCDSAMAFGGDASGNHLNTALSISDDGDTNDRIVPGFLKRCFMNTGFKWRFANRYADLLNTALKVERTTNIVAQAASRIDSEITRTAARWTNMGSYSAWQDGVTTFSNFFVNRPGYQWTYLKAKCSSENFAAVTLTNCVGQGAVKINTITSGKHFELPFTGQYFTDIPVKFTALPEAGYEFSGWYLDGTMISDSTEMEIYPTEVMTLQAVFQPAAVSDQQSLRLLEIYGSTNKDIDSSGDVGEYVVITNTSDKAVALAGLRLVSEKLKKGEYTVTLDLSLTEGEIPAYGTYKIDQSLWPTEDSKISNGDIRMTITDENGSEIQVANTGFTGLADMGGASLIATTFDNPCNDWVVGPVHDLPPPAPLPDIVLTGDYPAGTNFVLSESRTIVLSNATFGAGIAFTSNGVATVKLAEGTANAAVQISAEGKLVIGGAGQLAMTGAGDLLKLSGDLEIIGGDIEFTLNAVKEKSAIANNFGSYVQTGGRVTVNLTGDVQAYGFRWKDVKGPTVTISGGEFIANIASGEGSVAFKGNKGSNDFTLSGGKLTVTLDAVDVGVADMGGNVKIKGTAIAKVTGTETATHARVFKTEKKVTISDTADIDIKVPGEESESFSADNEIIIEGGVTRVDAGDDCFSAQTNIVISGGVVYGHSIGNDVFDSNGRMTISGGTVIAYTLAEGHEAFDTEPATDDGQDHTFTITGGTVVGLGGKGSAWPEDCCFDQNTSTGSGLIPADYSEKYLVLDGKYETVYAQLPAIADEFVLLATVADMTGYPTVDTAHAGNQVADGVPAWVKTKRNQQYVRFCEIYGNTTGGTEEEDNVGDVGEYFVLTNISADVVVDLTGLKINIEKLDDWNKKGEKKSKCLITLTGGTIAPGASVRFDQGDPDYTNGWTKITNGDLYIALTDSDGNKVQSGETSNSYFAECDGNGASLIAKTFGSEIAMTADDWEPSFRWYCAKVDDVWYATVLEAALAAGDGGVLKLLQSYDELQDDIAAAAITLTPGEGADIYTNNFNWANAAALRMTEIMPKPTDGEYDVNGLTSGWVELKNTTNAWVDLKDYKFVRVNRKKKTDTSVENFPSEMIGPNATYKFLTSERYSNSADSTVSAWEHGTFDGNPVKYGSELNNVMVWGDKVNPKKFCFVRLYYAPGGDVDAGSIVDTVVIPSDLPESWSIVVDAVEEGVATTRWMQPRTSAGEIDTTQARVRLGPNVGPLYEILGQKKHSKASEFADIVPPADTNADYEITFALNPVMHPTVAATKKKVAFREEDEIKSVRIIYRTNLDDATLATNEVDLATKKEVYTEDGITYKAVIPNSAFAGIGPGRVIQWKFLVTDNCDNEWVTPSFNNKDDGYEWYGTITEPGDLNSAKLPTWHMFLDDASLAQMDKDADAQTLPYNARAAIYDSSTSNYYDYVRIDLRGNSSRNFTKKSHGFRFAKSHPLTMTDIVSGETIEEIRKTSLIAEPADPSYMRQLIAFWLLNKTGSPAPFDFPVRVNRNGEFYQMGFNSERFTDELIEDVYKLDKYGYGYKNVGTLKSGSGTTAGSIEKKTPDDGNESDKTVLQNELRAKIKAAQKVGGTTEAQLYGTDTTGLDNAELTKFVVQKFNLPAWLNYLAATRITQEMDDVWANLSIYYDNPEMKEGVRGTGTWMPLAYDMNVSFGQHYIEGGVGRTGPIANLDRFKCHPFYGGNRVRCYNKDDCSGTLNSGNDGFESVWQNAKFRRLYLRRLRTLMDQELKAPGTAEEDVPMMAKMRELEAIMREDAATDRAKWPDDGSFSAIDVWGTSKFPSSMAAGIDDLWTNYIVPRQTHLYVTHSVTNTSDSWTVGYGVKCNAGIPESQAAAKDFIGKITIANLTTLSAEEQESLGVDKLFTDTNVVVIANTSDEVVDLSGWQLKNSVNYTLPAGTVVDSNDCIYVVANRKNYVAAMGDDITDQVIVGNAPFDVTGPIALVADDGTTIFNKAPMTDARRYLRLAAFCGNTTEGDGDEGEWFALTNISDSVDLDLTGVTVCFLKEGDPEKDTDHCHVSFAKGTLKAGASKTFTKDDFEAGWIKIQNNKLGINLYDVYGSVIQKLAVEQKKYPTAYGNGGWLVCDSIEEEVGKSQWHEDCNIVITVEGVDDVRHLGELVTLSTVASVTNGLTNVVCVGWIGTGSIPADGTEASVSFTLTESSSITWLYATNYWLEVADVALGTVAGAESGWYRAGTEVTLTATAALDGNFEGWTGDVADELAENETISLVLDSPKSVRAVFKPVWSAELRSNQMSVYARVFDDAAGVYLESEGSVLAAFDAQGNCRGRGTFKNGRYRLQVQLDSQSEAGIVLKLWDAATGKLITLPETISGAKGDVGNVASPRTFCVSGAGTVFTIAQGWNLISVNRTPSSGDLTPASVFADVAFADDDVIKSGTEMATYSGGKWYPADFTLKAGVGYMVKKSTPGGVSRAVVGDLASSSLEVASGWNWFGSWVDDVMNVSRLVSTGGFTNEDIIRGATDFAEYNAGVWESSSDSDFVLTPGLGYKAYFEKAGSLGFGVSKRLKLAVASVDAPSDGWAAVVQRDNAQVYITVTNDLAITGAQLALFTADGECRGVASAIEGPSGTCFALPAGVATAGEVLSIRVRTADGATLKGNATVTVSANASIGTIAAPMPIGVEVEASDGTVIFVTDAEATEPILKVQVDGEAKNLRLAGDWTNCLAGAEITPATFNAIGKNSIPVWQSYVLGVDPTEEKNVAEQIHATITMNAEGEPEVHWEPDASGDDNRKSFVTYTKLGKQTLDADEQWHEAAAGDHFFRVKVEIK